MDKTVIVLTLQVNTDDTQQLEEVVNNFRAAMGEHYTEVEVLDQIVSSYSEFTSRLREADDILRQLEIYATLKDTDD
jgi:hypothetical protein